MKIRPRSTVSIPFMMMSILFCICLISSNLFETKLFTLFGITLTGGVVIFPVSYIINDCLVEVYGYKKSRLVIWTAFAMNFFLVGTAQIVRVLPDSPFWDGSQHFDYVVALAPRVVLASMLAFICGSTVNAVIMSKMKVSQAGKRFSVRAMVSTIAGESIDSLVFFPIAFFGTETSVLIRLMLTQVILKTAYEAIILPLTNLIVKHLKEYEHEDIYDINISYNPFKIGDLLN